MDSQQEYPIALDNMKGEEWTRNKKQKGQMI